MEKNIVLSSNKRQGTKKNPSDQWGCAREGKSAQYSALPLNTQSELIINIEDVGDGLGSLACCSPKSGLGSCAGVVKSWTQLSD